MNGYRIKEVAQIVGVAPVTLQKWISKGLIPNVSTDQRGSCLFSENNLNQTRLLLRNKLQNKLGKNIEYHQKNVVCTKKLTNGDKNRLFETDHPIHDWYRFVLSFPPQIVRSCIERFDIKLGQNVLDPFCGTGTTLVECKKNGIASYGHEAHPMSAFASNVKVDWSVKPDLLREYSHVILRAANKTLAKETKLRTLPPQAEKLLLKNSICPLPLHKALILHETIKKQNNNEAHKYALLAFAKTLVSDSSNLHFGPEIGVRGRKEDAPVFEAWGNRLFTMADDLETVRDRNEITSRTCQHDSREMPNIPAHCIDAVITSPPYPNEKDYTRTTRLESVLLEFISDRADLKAMKQGLLRSNTRNIYKADQDYKFIELNNRICKLADEIENRRIELGKTSGFEKQYSKVVLNYFGGMTRHFSNLRRLLRPGAKLAYIVGDQASFFRIMIRTGELLAEIASELGYKVLEIDLFRTRISTATKQQLREEILILEWPKH